jgi:hypothetical protein
MARSHVELIAAGLETFLEAGAEADTSLLSTIPIGSFAGLALTLVHCPAARCIYITVSIQMHSTRNLAR